MTFLNPLLLFLLPLAALPILIHLINQRRHRTIEWGAMMFLLSAKRMSKGMARLRQIMIMAARMLAIIGLIFAIGRPLATGWFGALTGGKPECVIVILDRSASMQQQKLETGETKLVAGLGKIVDMIETFEGAKRLVLIESTTNQPVTISSAKTLLDLPKTTGTDATSDVPGMLQTALEFVVNNQTGRTDIWICSDARENDWDSESSRWPTLKSQFAGLDGIRFHVLNFAEPPTENLSVTVERAERVDSKGKSELALDVRVRRTGDFQDAQDVPLEFSVNGVRSVVNLKMEDEEYLLTGHRILIDRELKIGWGKVELPADSNLSDNAFYFAFSESPVYQTVIVSDDSKSIEALKIACTTASSPNQSVAAKVVGTDQLDDIEWSATALVLWQTKLPQGQVATQVSNFINRGRNVIFFPPSEVDQTEFQGARWGEWVSANADTSHVVGFWRNEDDLLQKTRNGQALPLDEVRVYRYCSIQGENRLLARLENGQPFIARAVTDTGGAYFCSTLPAGSYSSLARNGIVMFAMLHRALASGASTLGATKTLNAGTTQASLAKQLGSISSPDDAILADSRPYLAGVYGDEKQMVAINRPLVEDTAPGLTRETINGLFEGLDFHVIDDQLGSLKSLASEIWKVFVVLMGLALLTEVILCLPPKPENPIEIQPTGLNS